VYVELHAYSNFTFLEGGSHPEELIRHAKELGMKAIALTDRDGLYGSVRFAAEAAKHDIEAIVGSELTFEDGTRVVLLVQNERGYANLCDLISQAQLRGSKHHAKLHLDDFAGRAEGLFALSTGAHVLPLREYFGDCLYLELQQHLTPQEAARNAHLLQLGRELGIPCVATNGVFYARQEDAQLADILLCIQHTITLNEARAKHLLRPNWEYYLKSAEAMQRLFADYPEAIEATAFIAARCTFRLERIVGQFPLYEIPQEYPSTQVFLEQLVMNGAYERYGYPLDAAVTKQLTVELDLIERMDLVGYFLIVWDIVQAAHARGVLCQGRGSAANSAVCYALTITAVDPIGMGLLFERFMSENRKEIPDIDIDFAHQDREQVIQYVYERYGRANAAMAAEVVSYGHRSAIRDIGKVLGYSVAQVDELAKDYDTSESLQAVLRDAPQRGAPQDDKGQLLTCFVERIEQFPRHMSIHSGGIVVTKDALRRVAPIEWATMRDRTIIQWDKDDLQYLGLIKIDLLGLGMLSLLREAFAMHERVNGQHYELHTIPQGDAATYTMMQRADTIGVFQIESRAQMTMLPRLKPKTFYDIVMQVAIIRPGPIQGQMIHPFLERREKIAAGARAEDVVTYPHPKLKPILERTLGVPLFQEQGIRMAVEVAGFTPGEADELRRAMGHKRSHERMLEIYPKLVQGMVDNGITGEDADRFFKMLEGFADYGFPESHAASFALLAYESAYLKCHHPAIFTAAILNVQPLGFYSNEVLVNDAKHHGVIVKPVEINASEYLSHVEPDGSLRLGFHLIRDLGTAQREGLERALWDGPFRDLLDFARRTKLGKDALESLAVAGAFVRWYPSRREAMWALRALDEREARGELGKLMDVHEPGVTFAQLTPKESAGFDLWATGVTPKGQIIEHFRPFLSAQHVLTAQQARRTRPASLCRVGGLVITRQHPGTAKGFVFMTIEDETGYIDIIVRPKIYEQYRRTIRTKPMLVVEGTLQNEQGVVGVLAHQMWSFDDEGLADRIKVHHFH